MMDPGQVPPEAHSHRDPMPTADPVGLLGPADSHSCVTLVFWFAEWRILEQVRGFS